ncbi:recombinase family protein [Streptomyces sp. MMBL 11-1]|uniref:recombinase family protein n=1 Tax=Streptomyces sp. MMBL 11-1 TaxID=3026420 RepID=UPI00235FC8FE|nr:recombinase family protein [Streptomyces sp. MMBL 11-1]
MTNCLLYARISEDPREQERGVKRQVQDLRAYAQARGWTVLETFTDNDISAYNGEQRPDYVKLIARVAEGDIDVVVALHPSRLWRRRVERAIAIDLFQQHGIAVAFETGGYFDCTKAIERSQLAQVGESDTLESEVKAERVAREALSRAEEGRANGAVSYGWRRVYTYNQQGKVESFHDEINPEEAEIVREVIKRLLAGESVIKVTADLNTRRVLPPGANLVMKKKQRAKGNEDGLRWSKTSVKKLALRPANGGFRQHRGVLYPAAFPALVDEEKWRQVVKLLTAPERSVKRDGSRKHLLSWGIGECGVCASVLRVATKSRYKLYVCDSMAGCTGRNEAYVDAWVTEVVLARLSRPDALAVFGPDEERIGRLRVSADGMKKRLEEAADDYADGLLTREQLRAVTVKLKQQIAGVEQEIERETPTLDLASMGDLVGAPLEVAEVTWEGLDVVQRRAVLEALNLRVVILPTGKRGPGFDPDFVKVLTAGGEPFASS